MRTKYQALAIILLLLHRTSPADDGLEFRTWTSAKGDSIEARFKGIENGKVRLQAKTGRELRIDWDLLSDEDWLYLHDRSVERPLPKLSVGTMKVLYHPPNSRMKRPTPLSISVDADENVYLGFLGMEWRFPFDYKAFWSVEDFYKQDKSSHIMPYDQYENVTAVVWREGYGETFRLVLKRREHMRPEAFTDDQIEVHFRGRDVSAFRKLTQRADAVLKAAKTAETARAANQRCQKYREKVAAHEHEKGKRLGREWRATAKETTIVEIENFGHRYKTENKVKLTGVAFSGLDNTWAANQEKRIGWPLVGFHISQEDELFQFCFVSEVKYDDLLLSLKRGARVDLYGFVFDMGMNGWHGFMCVLIDNEE